MGLGHSGRGVVLAMQGGRGHLGWANSDWAGKGACWRRVLSFSFFFFIGGNVDCMRWARPLTCVHLF